MKNSKLRIYIFIAAGLFMIMTNMYAQSPSFYFDLDDINPYKKKHIPHSEISENPCYDLTAIDWYDVADIEKKTNGFGEKGSHYYIIWEFKEDGHFAVNKMFETDLLKSTGFRLHQVYSLFSGEYKVDMSNILYLKITERGIKPNNPNGRFEVEIYGLDTEKNNETVTPSYKPSEWVLQLTYYKTTKKHNTKIRFDIYEGAGWDMPIDEIKNAT